MPDDKHLPPPFRVALGGIRTLVGRPHWLRASDANRTLDVMLTNLGGLIEPSKTFDEAAQALKTAVADLAQRANCYADTDPARDNCEASIDNLAKALESVKRKP